MEIKQVVEYFTQATEDNKVISIDKTFITGSIEVTKKETGTAVSFKEMGTNIIRLLETVGINEVIKITYKTSVSNVNTDLDILKELRELRARCEALEEQQNYLLAGLQERVPMETFKQWIWLMEKSFGKVVLDNSHLQGVQGVSMPPWKRS